MDQFIIDSLAASGYSYDPVRQAVVPLNASPQYLLDSDIRNFRITPDQYLSQSQNPTYGADVLGAVDQSLYPASSTAGSAPAATVTAPSVPAGAPSYTDKQIYDAMVASNQQGFSNADILTGASRLGLTQDDVMRAYQSQRPELFGGSAALAPPAPYDPTAGGTLPGTMDLSALMAGAPAAGSGPGAIRPAYDSTFMGGFGYGGNTQAYFDQMADPAGGAPAAGGSIVGGFGYQSSPWMSSVADDIGRRTQQGLGQAFSQIRSNAVGNGTLGGSRQGVAEGIATRGAMDSMQGQLAGLFGQDWTNSQNRGLQRYGLDTNAYLTGRGQDQGFYTAQRGQDLTQLGLGANIYDMGVKGGWAPLQNASGIFNTTAGNNVTSTSGGTQGGGWGGAAGGLLAGGALAKNMGWGWPT